MPERLAPPARSPGSRGRCRGGHERGKMWRSLPSGIQTRCRAAESYAHAMARAVCSRRGRRSSLPCQRAEETADGGHGGEPSFSHRNGVWRVDFCVHAKLEL